MRVGVRVGLAMEEKVAAINLNTEYLDSLVMEHLKGKPEGVVLGETIKGKVKAGEISEAIGLAESACPGLFEKDQRIYFKLKQQQFVEYLRAGTKEGQKHALELLRQELNPLALNAYLEAYAELKHCLMTLVFDENIAETPVSEYWDIQTRNSLAGRLARSVRQYIGEQGSRLSLMLRYMALINSSYCKANKGDAGLCEILQFTLAETACAEHREAPPTPPENWELADGMMEGINNTSLLFMMSMKNTLQITRSEVTDSLKVARGDKQVALKNELAALPIDDSLVNRMVTEYAKMRGLQKEATRSNATAYEQRMASGEHNSRNRRHPSESPPKKVARYCSGTQEAKHPASINNANTPLDFPGTTPKQRPEAIHWNTEAFQHLRGLTEAGRLEEVIKAIREKAQNFLEENPSIHFELLSASVQQLLESAKVSEALVLIRSKLTPISNEHAFLQPKLKGVVSRLVPGSGNDKSLSLTSLANLLEKELSTWLGLAEPALVKVLKVMLAAHTEWFHKERCCDPLALLLGIDELRQAPCVTQPQPEVGSGLQDRSNEQDADQELTRFEDLALEFDEELVSDTMDITNLGRAEVIEMLRECDGDREMLLEQFFQ